MPLDTSVQVSNFSLDTTPTPAYKDTSNMHRAAASHQIRGRFSWSSLAISTVVQNPSGMLS